MKMGWTRIPTRQKWALVGIGILLCVVTLHTVVWAPILEDVERVQVEIQQQEREIQAHLQKISHYHGVEQQLNQVRSEVQTRLQAMPPEVDPSTFRKNIMALAGESGVTVRIWKPEGMFPDAEKTSQISGIAMKVEGAFPQAVRFLSGVGRLPWVRSITSVSIEGREKPNGGFSTVMEIHMQGLTGSGLARFKKLLPT